MKSCSSLASAPFINASLSPLLLFLLLLLLLFPKCLPLRSPWIQRFFSSPSSPLSSTSTTSTSHHHQPWKSLFPPFFGVVAALSSLLFSSLLPSFPPLLCPVVAVAKGKQSKALLSLCVCVAAAVVCSLSCLSSLPRPLHSTPLSSSSSLFPPVQPCS